MNCVRFVTARCALWCVLKRAVVTIPAHDNRIATMSFNALGNRIATASEKVVPVS